MSFAKLSPPQKLEREPQKRIGQALASDPKTRARRVVLISQAPYYVFLKIEQTASRAQAQRANTPWPPFIANDHEP
jgi:hypothetical protein